MYHRMIGFFVLLQSIFVLAFCCVAMLPDGELHLEEQAGEVRLDGRMLSLETGSTLGIVEATASDRRVVSISSLQATTEQTESTGISIEISDEDRAILERIVEAEAGGEDADGKLLVANVVLNRVASEAFPDTVAEVVFQCEQGVVQFSPVADGRYWSVTVSDETRAAVERALQGEDLSCGALYFTARRYVSADTMAWFDENLTCLFTHGGHEFFR